MNTVERIFELINNNGIKAAQLAKELNFPSGIISQWKIGRNNPSADALAKIADYFNVSVDYLLGRTDNPQNQNSAISLPEDAMQFLNLWNKLNDNQKDLIMGTMLDFAGIDEKQSQKLQENTKRYKTK